MIEITSKQAGFRRCGIAHPEIPTEYPDDAFAKEQLEILLAEPMLTVVTKDDPDQLKAGEAIARATACQTVADLDALMNGETRKTVLAAIDAKRKELEG